MAPTCTNCSGTDFVWANELKTGGVTGSGGLSLRSRGEIPLGTRICRTCGHAELFLRDLSVLHQPHNWKPGEFIPIPHRPKAAPAAPATPPPAAEPAPLPATPMPPPHSPPPMPPLTPAPATPAPLATPEPAAMAEPASTPSGEDPAPPTGETEAKPKATRRRSSRSK